MSVDDIDNLKTVLPSVDEIKTLKENKDNYDKLT